MYCNTPFAVHNTCMKSVFSCDHCIAIHFPQGDRQCHQEAAGCCQRRLHVHSFAIQKTGWFNFFILPHFFFLAQKVRSISRVNAEIKEPDFLSTKLPGAILCMKQRQRQLPAVYPAIVFVSKVHLMVRSS